MLVFKTNYFFYIQIFKQAVYINETYKGYVLVVTELQR